MSEWHPPSVESRQRHCAEFYPTKQETQESPPTCRSLTLFQSIFIFFLPFVSMLSKKFNPNLISFHPICWLPFHFPSGSVFDLFCYSLMILSLMISGSKGNKSGNLNGTLNLLVSVFGGASALKKGAPICAGRYNSTKANEASVWD